MKLGVFSITTLNKMTLSKVTLGILSKVTLGILSVTIKPDMPNVIVLSVVRLNVLAPQPQQQHQFQRNFDFFQFRER